MNRIRCIAGVLAVGAGLWLVSATEKPTGKDEAPLAGRPAAPPGESGTHRGGERPYLGVALQIHTSERAAIRYGRLVEEIAELGADTVLISINGFQEHVDSVRIERLASATPSDEALLELIAKAHGLGLRVILMPKILLSDPRGGAWRGQITPPTWDGWFDQYRAFVGHYAGLAERARVEVFILGSELISAEKHTDQWVRTINEMRRIYRGRLAYSANWDHYSCIQFWNKLDLVGMTTYYKLADKPGPTLGELRSRWREIRARILEFQAATGKPILFTEVGWCSQEGCSLEGWNYYRTHVATPAGHEEQRRNFQAFVDTWAGEPALGGMIWWEWTEGEGGPADCGYTPKNKPAEQVLRDLFRRP